MKKLLIVGLLACMRIHSLTANNAYRSYFSVRPYSQHVTPQNILVGQAHDNGYVLKMSSIEATIFGGVSTNSEKLAKYFFFGGKTELVVRETPPANVIATELGQDILADNFNIDVQDGFRSVISLKPKQTFVGVALSAKKHFREKYWASVEVPFLRVRNDLHFVEKITNPAVHNENLSIDSAPTAGNMKDAFKQPAMKYGKIDGPQKKRGVGDVTLKFGYDCPHFNRDDLFITSYLGVVLPTSNKPKAVYMFEPLLGNGGHTALMFGSRGEVELRNYRNGTIWMSWGIESQYLFQNIQKRSFDLKRNGAWSRYLQMYATEAKRASNTAIGRSFGINLLTLDAKVTPGYIATFNTALSYVGKQWHGTIGYTTIARQKETIKLKNAWQEGPMITAYVLADGVNPFHAIGTELADLDSNAAPDSAASVIKATDIDLNSAAHPATISNMLYVSIGAYCPCNYQRVFEAGVSYECGKDNTTLNRMGAWAKVQISL